MRFAKGFREPKNDALAAEARALAAADPDFDPRWRRTLYAIWFAQVLAIVGFTLRTPFLPFFLKDIGAESTNSATVWSGVIMAGGAFVMAFTAPLWGIVSDRRGRKPMILRAMFAGALTVGLMGLATAPWHLLALRFLEGALTGTVTASTALVASSTPKARLGFSLGLIQMAVFSGASVGPLFGGLLAAWIGYRGTFVVAGAMLAVGGFVVLFLVNERFTPMPRGPERGMAAVRASRSWLLVPIMVTMVSVLMVVRVASMSTQPILPLFIEQLGTFSDERASTITGIALGMLGLTSAISSVWLGKRGDRVGHRRVLLWCAFAAGVLYLPMAFVTQPWQIIVLLGVFGIAAGGLIPTANALVAEATPPQRRGVIYGVTAGALSIGGFFGPLMGSAVSAWFGFRVAFAIAAVMLMVMAVVVMRVFGREKVAAAGAVGEVAG